MKWIDPPGGKPWALLGLCSASALLNIVLIGNLILPGAAEKECSADAPLAQETMQPAPQVPVADQTPLATQAVSAPGPAAVKVESATAPVTTTGAPRDVARGKVTHSLARTFQTAAPGRADVLNAVYSRLFFWDLDLRRDLQKGDEVEAGYRWDGTLAHIDVARYHSNKLGKVLGAYRFRASGDTFDSYWNEEGLEVPRRLKNGPLREYEQVTALIKDRPSHKGMDFKTPVGTLIVSPRPGRVQRTNWNFKFNGNCVEVLYNDGTKARFLHLSETSVKPGQTVGAGEKIGLTGNTGRSTAPHLHYEMDKGGRVIDPVDYHGLERRTLKPEDRQRFESTRRELDGTLSSAS
jgi:murein DD-endopeptidase